MATPKDYAILEKKSDQELLNITKLIYIPQGFSGRLTLESVHLGIEGLYTDDYGICKILICISKDKTKGILCHVDIDTVNRWGKIQAEIKWVGENQDIYIIGRAEDGIPGQIVKAYLLTNLQHNLNMPVNIHQEYVDLSIDGISLSLQNKTGRHNMTGNISPYIQTYVRDKSPRDLYHHPEEEACLAVQKIEQIIGQRAKIKLKKIREKEVSIFDGYAWESLRTETRLDDQLELNREEIEFFKITDTFVDVMGKLSGIIQNTSQMSKESVVGPFDRNTIAKSSRDVAFYMESYLNNFKNIIEIFTRNLRDTFDNPVTPVITEQDRQIKAKMLALKGDKLFDEACQLFEHYQDGAPESAFKKAVCPEFKMIREHCQKRLEYERIRQQKGQNKKDCLNLNANGLARFNNQDYRKAFSFFSSAINHLSFSTDTSDDQLAALYYNASKALLKMNLYKRAKHFLAYCIKIRRKNSAIKGQKELVTKSETALIECNQKALLSEYLTNYLPQFGLQLSQTMTTLPGDHIMEYCDVGVEKVGVQIF